MPAIDYADTHSVNCTTGGVTIRPLTDSEVTERDALAATAQQEKADADAKEQAQQADEDTVRAAIDALTFDAATEALARLVLGE